ncbi:MAG: hypothetical protein P4L99_20085 [Chthoniobacter sp.]|nr:hypothetical protein [Chthoniobacter sp.]
MKATLHYSCALLAGVALLLTATIAEARSYGVSSSSAGPGTKYTTSRGGTAYVGPNGAAAQGANGRTAAATKNGAAYSGPNAAGVSTRNGGAAAVTSNGNVYTKQSTTVVATRPVTTSTAVVVAPLPAGYIRVVPTGYTTVVYGGYNCYFVGGVYYRAVFYGGETVYVVVR